MIISKRNRKRELVFFSEMTTNIREWDIKSTPSPILDRELSELRFDLFFLKCQLIMEKELAKSSSFSDVNDEIASMEMRIAAIEQELASRNEPIYSTRYSSPKGYEERDVEALFYELQNRLEKDSIK